MRTADAHGRVPASELLLDIVNVDEDRPSSLNRSVLSTTLASAKIGNNQETERLLGVARARGNRWRQVELKFPERDRVWHKRLSRAPDRPVLPAAPRHAASQRGYWLADGRKITRKPVLTFPSLGGAAAVRPNGAFPSKDKALTAKKTPHTA